MSLTTSPPAVAEACDYLPYIEAIFSPTGSNCTTATPKLETQIIYKINRLENPLLYENDDALCFLSWWMAIMFV